jgi:hypothetical protein
LIQEIIMSSELKIVLSGLICGGVVLLAGCGKQAATVSTSPSPTSLPNLPAVVVSPSPSPSPSVAAESRVISDQAIGSARLGMKLGDLKKALGKDVEFGVQSPFIVDFDAIAVKRGGEIQYYILYLAKQPPTDNDVIQGLLTRNPKFLTKEGIGAGTPLTKAQQAYGKATLSYNTQNESREYVRFEQQPAGISFGTGNGAKEAVGVYPSATAEYNETQQFKENAKIQSVLVVCLNESCAPPTATPSPSPSTSPSP